jgi:hypothetical protein
MRYIYFFAILLLAACTALPAKPEVSVSSEAVTSLVAPQIIVPANGSEFVESTLWLEWNWPSLEETQFFVLRFWYGEEAPQELWTKDSRLNAQSLIDSYSRDIGDYHWQVAIVNTSESGGFEAMGSEWSEIQNLYRVRHLSLAPLPLEQMSPAAAFISEQGFTTATELIDFTRSWMFQNTFIGDELLVYSPDYSDAAQLMYNHSKGDGEAPQMYCNGISTTLLTVLRELGIDSRLIFLYGEVEGYISEHTVLEVFNPDIQRWEIHDSTRDYYFIDTSTMERVSIERLVFGSLDSIQACTNEGCDAELEIEYLFRRLGAFRYGYSTELWVNPDRFNMSRRVEAFENANFAEFIAKEAGVPVQSLEFHFDSWQ